MKTSIQPGSLLVKVSLLFLLGLMATCNFEDDVKIAPIDEIEPTAALNNPFATDNILEAFDNIISRSNNRIEVAAPSTTHNYIRFSPQNLDQIMLLNDLGYELWNEPLDQHVSYSGDYYNHPGMPDSLNYFYTLIPVNYSIVQSVPHTIISQVILFDEDAGDEQDPEEDPWIPSPDPGGGHCYDEWGAPYVCGTDPRIYYRENQTLPEDLVKKTTKHLLDAGIDLIELYNEAMKLAGHYDEIIEHNSSVDSRTESIRYYPSGIIRVRDNSTNLNVPLKGVKVKSRRYLKIKSTFTNANGAFYINKGYRQKAQVIVKFKNNWANVRGINGSLKLWQYVFPLKKNLGLFEKSSLENIQFTFPYTSNANQISSLQFAAAHSLNTLWETRQYCVNNNIGQFSPGNGYKLNIWISSVHTSGASAPMLRAIANSSLISAAIDFLLPGIGTAAKRIVQNYLPDVTMRLQDHTGNTRFAKDISQLFFHEFGHTIHYNKVGNNYWTNVIAGIVANGGYGNKNGSHAGYIAVAESWGFFIGSTFNRTKYISNPTIRDDEHFFLEFQGRDDSVPVAAFNGSFSRGWIPWGMHHDLIDSGEPGITLINDAVSGYTINGIFKGFHQGSTSIQNLKAAILANNGNNQATQVNTLVTSYGW